MRRSPDRSHRPTRRLTLPVVLLVSGAGVGCRSVVPPQLTFSDPVVTERFEDRTRIEFLTQVSNLNSGALPLKEFEYVFGIDGREVFRTRRAAGATIGGQRSQRITLPVILPSETAARLAQSSRPYQLSGKLIYVAPGTLAEALFDIGLQTPSVSFSSRGEMSLESQ